MLGELTCWQSQVVHLAEGAGPDHDNGEPICQQGAEIEGKGMEGWHWGEQSR